MKRIAGFNALAFSLLLIPAACAVDWTQFRGPGGLASSDDKGLPVNWSDDENIVWKTKLDGIGCSTPAVMTTDSSSQEAQG